MFRVYLSQFKRWIENVPVEEALVYKEVGLERNTHEAHQTTT
jgi:hypothetical protein